MNEGILAGVMEATRLTQSGRLAEATALIQRSLAGSAGASGAYAAPSPNAPLDDEVIEGVCSEVGTETAPPPEAHPSGHAADTDASARTAGRHGVRDWLKRWQDRGASRPVAEPPGAGQPGEFVAGLFANPAGERAYKLYIPSSYSGQALPLIVMLHGCTQTPDDFAAGTGMNGLGEERQCFVLYPAQSSSANHSRCWNWFRREDQARDRGEPSIIAGMTRDVMGRYGIDPAKVYVAGLSAGGAMAAVLGVVHADLYTAVGIHSGLACGSAHDLPSAMAAMKGMPASAASARGAGAKAVPTIVFHGDRDKTVHPDNGARVVSQANVRHDAGDVVRENGTVPGGHSYTKTVHRDAAGRVVLEHWVVHGGGHAWFGGSPAGSYTDPRGPNATREMVRFFLQLT